MFLFVPLHQVQVVTGKAAEGTYKGFYCVGLPDMGITSISWPSYGVTLWAGPLSNASHHDNYWLLWALFFFHWWRRGWHRGLLSNFHRRCWLGWCCLCGCHLPFKLVQKAGEVIRACLIQCLLKQLLPFCHCAVPLCHHLIPGCYFSNRYKQKVIQFDMFNTYMHLIIEILMFIFYVQHRVQYSTVPVKIFLLVSWPFLNILSTSWSSSTHASSSSSELSMTMTPLTSLLISNQDFVSSLSTSSTCNIKLLDTNICLTWLTWNRL